MKNSHAVILALGLILGFTIFGAFFYGARAGRDTISVVGSATERFESDIVKWQITISQSAGLDELSVGFERIAADMESLRAILLNQGFAEDELTVKPVNSHQTYDRDRQPTGYEISQTLQVISEKIDQAEELALDPSAMARRDLYVRNSRIEYLLSELSEIKLGLLAAATDDAKARAEEIAERAGVSIGNARSLRAGVFQIRAPHSTEVSGYGIYNTQSRSKDVTVTVHATFQVD
jgi:hypothetical protein